jgi:hypothetical protein
MQSDTEVTTTGTPPEVVFCVRGGEQEHSKEMVRSHAFLLQGTNDESLLQTPTSAAAGMRHALRDTSDYKSCTSGRVGPPHDDCWIITAMCYKGIWIITGGWVTSNGEYYIVICIRVRVRSGDKRVRDIMGAKLEGGVLGDPVWFSVHLVDGAPSRTPASETECVRLYLRWFTDECTPARLTHHKTVLGQGGGDNEVGDETQQ